MRCGRVLLCIILMKYMITGAFTLDVEEDPDSVLTDVRYLYDEPTQFVDPNDMLADFDAFRKPPPSSKDNAENGLLEKPGCASVQQDLNDCTLHLDLVNKKLKSESGVTGKLQKKLSEDGRVDYQPLYHRTIALLWSAMQLQHTDSKSLVFRKASLQVTAELVATLHTCVNEDTLGPHQCDVAVSGVLRGITVEPEEPTLLTRLLETDWRTVLHYTNTLDAALYVLAGALLLLVSWSVNLLIRDMRTNRRWWTFLLMLLLLTFIFCCLWNWKNMIKEAESRRASAAESRGGLQPECGNPGFWVWLRGSTDVKCEKYHYDLFISAAAEVTPEAVFVRTATTLIMSPMRILGKEMGLFFAEFYGNVPWLFMIPATVFMPLFLLVPLLLFFGYSIELPFMGGIRPSSAASQTPALNMDAVTKQLREEQRQFLLESRRMMLDISSAVSREQSAVSCPRPLQPILFSSCRSIENQLDNIISSRLNSLLTHSSAGDGAAPTPAIATLTHSCSDTPDGAVTHPSTDSQQETDDVTAICGESGAVGEDTDRFYKEVCYVLDESLNASQQDDGATVRAGNITPSRRRVSKSTTETANLSPAAKKFLSEVKDALES